MTTAEGEAAIRCLDGSGQARFVTQTSEGGDCLVQVNDTGENTRVVIASQADGLAGISWLDADGVKRIGASISAEGEVEYPGPADEDR